MRRTTDGLKALAGSMVAVHVSACGGGGGGGSAVAPARPRALAVLIAGSAFGACITGSADGGAATGAGGARWIGGGGHGTLGRWPALPTHREPA